MGLKAKRVCDTCLLEQKEDFFINRDDIKDVRRCGDVGWIVNWLCDKCKKNKKLLGESVDPTLESKTEDEGNKNNGTTITETT
ncbi:hypothetical protein HN803_03760 [candidate division WWE3 bacterium]|jgi:hypothetical protein|nr:hypothetical protein [candidate division WWE3 bacterium]